MEEKRNWFIPVIGAAIMLFIAFVDELADKGWLLPAVGLLCVLVFGFFGFIIFKEWQKPDEEVLIKGYPGDSSQPQATLRQRLMAFAGAVIIVVNILFRKQQRSPADLIFCAIGLICAGGFLLPALIQKLRGKEGEPLFPNAQLQPLQIVHMLFGLAATGFACFWCYMMITKGIWWMSFPGFIIGAGAARPFVAGVRILLGGKDSRKPKREIEPWDRPDKK